MIADIPKIIKNGVFCVPLYHGTSTLFSDSIRQHGLGAINPIARLSVLPFMKDVFELCDRSFSGDQEWETSKVAVIWMLDQKVLPSSANFQHGQTYLTPSRSSAVGYALSNRFGSECLSQAYRIFRLLLENNPSAVSENKLDQHPLASLFTSKPKPVLITAHHIPLSYLVSEQDGPVEPVIRNLVSTLDILKDSGEPRDILKASGITINYNFRLTTPLSTDAITFEMLNVAEERNPYVL